MPSAPLSPASLWDSLDQRVCVIELHRLVKQDGNILIFETHNPVIGSLIVDKSYNYSAWWSPSELAIAQSDPSRWKRKTFKAEDAVFFKETDTNLSMLTRKRTATIPYEDNDIVLNGWDHEHCSLCADSISEINGEKNIGFTDSSEWVCEECYKKYIVSGFGKRLGDKR